MIEPCRAYRGLPFKHQTASKDDEREDRIHGFILLFVAADPAVGGIEETPATRGRHGGSDFWTAISSSLLKPAAPAVLQRDADGFEVVYALCAVAGYPVELDGVIPVQGNREGHAKAHAFLHIVILHTING